MPATAVIETPTAAVEETYRKAEEHFGHVPNLVKVMATNPELCSSITNFLIQALREGRVSWQFKELVILKTLRAFGSFYSYGAHEKLALELGNSPERIGDLANSLWRSSPNFAPGERAVFQLIETMAEDANAASTDEVWDPLYQHWDSGQLLELNAVITTIVNVGRMGDALGVADPVLFSRSVA